MSFESVISVWNNLALIVYFLLVGIGLFFMIRRARWYRVVGRPLPVLLKRDIVLFLGLAATGGVTLIVRVTGVIFDPDSLERLLFVVSTSMLFLGPLTYYTKVDVFDLDDPKVK